MVVYVESLGVGCRAMRIRDTFPGLLTGSVVVDGFSVLLVLIGGGFGRREIGRLGLLSTPFELGLGCELQWSGLVLQRPLQSLLAEPRVLRE